MIKKNNKRLVSIYGDATLENNEIIFNGNLFVYFTSSLHRSKMTMRREWKKMKSFCVFVCCKRISFFEKEKKNDDFS